MSTEAQDTGQISDGYHTFDELYRYRMLYHAWAIKAWQQAGWPVVKSHRHHDGEACFGGGWFIVSAQLPSGQVSNHYEDKYWDLFDCPEVETAPEWDGHTPREAADRIERALQDPEKAYWKGQKVYCAWPGCKFFITLSDQWLVDEINGLHDGYGLVMGPISKFSWACFGGKGCYCSSHWHLDPDDRYPKLGPREGT